MKPVEYPLLEMPPEEVLLRGMYEEDIQEALRKRVQKTADQGHMLVLYELQHME